MVKEKPCDSSQGFIKIAIFNRVSKLITIRSLLPGL
jgi:hypothetical protein